MRARFAFWLLIAATLIAPSAALSGPSPSSNTGLSVTDVTFVTGHQWVQLTGDAAQGVFRLYAATADKNAQLLDFPNMFIMHCSDHGRYMTIHFPPSYSLSGIEDATRVPETPVDVRYRSGSMTFTAELNRKEFHIDFDDDVFAQLAILLNSPTVEMKLGPSRAQVLLQVGDSEFDRAQEQMLSDLMRAAKDPRHIEGKFSLQEIATQCFSPGPSVAGAKYWVVTGVAVCPDCDAAKSAITTHLKIGGGKGPFMRSRAECVKAVKVFSQSAQKNGLLAILQCTNVADPGAD
jgi:hypothetical protein